jgi:hypothetical protein
MRSLILLLALGCSSSPDPEVESYIPMAAATTDPSTAGQTATPDGSSGSGGMPSTEETAGTPNDSPAAGSGGMLAIGGMGGEPVAGMGGIGGTNSFGTLGGMGGKPAAVCCSGVYNGFGQCLDDGSVCGGAGMAGTTSAPSCSPTPSRSCNTDGFGTTTCRFVCSQGWCHYDGSSGTCVAS